MIVIMPVAMTMSMTVSAHRAMAISAALGIERALHAPHRCAELFHHILDDVVVAEPLDEALVTRAGKLIYPVRDGIPVLLEDQAMALAQLEGP